MYFYLEQDPVVFDWWVIFQGGKKRLATPEEVALWDSLLKTENDLVDVYKVLNRSFEYKRESKCVI